MEKEHVIVRRIDDLGRVVIPKAIRQKFNIDEGDALKIEIDERTGGFIMISKWVESEGGE
jgi:AbrB family looped-hinge helix DNA binding protein